MNYFTSDLHLGHKNITKYRDVFSDARDHDEYVFGLIEKLNKRDILFVLGDFLFDGDHYQPYLERLNKMPCRIKLVMGNHDSLKLHDEPKIEIQHPLYSYKSMWISHCPIHPNEMRDRYLNIHGHMHMETLDDPRYFNVNLDVNDYQFVHFDEIKRIKDILKIKPKDDIINTMKGYIVTLKTNDEITHNISVDCPSDDEAVAKSIKTLKIDMQPDCELIQLERIY